MLLSEVITLLGLYGEKVLRPDISPRHCLYTNEHIRRLVGLGKHNFYSSMFPLTFYPLNTLLPSELDGSGIRLK